ncbi:MAG: NADPH-dependent F420 reductase [Devosia sp.]
MKIGVLGTGMVGSAIGGKLVALGHDLMMGSRTPAGRTSVAPVGTYAEAAAHGDWVVNALHGESAIGILSGCAIDGKILIDIANYDSAVDQPIVTPLAVAIQAAFPKVRLVKTLNYVSAHLMVDPAALGEHTLFMAGDDAGAKAEVEALLRTFGWVDIIDLGGLEAVRAMEQLIPLWMALEKKLGGPGFQLRVVR